MLLLKHKGDKAMKVISNINKLYNPRANRYADLFKVFEKQQAPNIGLEYKVIYENQIITLYFEPNQPQTVLP